MASIFMLPSPWAALFAPIGSGVRDKAAGYSRNVGSTWEIDDPWTWRRHVRRWIYRLFSDGGVDTYQKKLETLLAEAGCAVARKCHLSSLSIYWNSRRALVGYTLFPIESTDRTSSILRRRGGSAKTCSRGGRTWRCLVYRSPTGSIVAVIFRSNESSISRPDGFSCTRR